MLFILTAPRKSGKTRWLETLTAALSAVEIPCYGVLAPGRWRALPDGSFKKLGIDNVLLPQGTLVPFAAPNTDKQTGTTNAASLQGSPASREPVATSGWTFSADSISQVNAHLAEIYANSATAHPGLLVIDELGPLELCRNIGLTQALKIASVGPTHAWPHAIVVVRPKLAETAIERFSPAWGTPRCIAPTPESRALVLARLVPNGKECS